MAAGNRDFTSLEEPAEICRSLPCGQPLILPDTGHAALGRRPELLNAIVHASLEAPEPAARGNR